MKRILILLAALIAAVATSAGPAQAYDEHYFTGANVHNGSHFGPGGGYTVVVENKFGWSRQGDGDGVVVLDMYPKVTAGCGDLESSPKLKNLSVATHNADGTIHASESMADADCNAHRAVSVRGPDTGPTVVTFNTEVNVNNGGNYCVVIKARLFADGSWDSQQNDDYSC